MNRQCRFDGCDRKPIAKGLCSTCYARFRRNGTPDHVCKQSGKGEGLEFLKAIPETDDCVKWPFGKGGNGYGVVFFMGRQTTASRASCIMHNGQPPDPSYQAAHRCGKGHLGCVNPRHLYWATPVGNTAEKYAHGTMGIGEKHPSSRLSEADVIEIRRRYGREPSGALAKEFSISRGYLWEVAGRKTWRHIQ